jgi:transposase
LFYLVREKPFDTAAIIQFIGEILQKTPQEISIVWDNASIHSSEEMRLFLENAPLAKRVQLIRFPPYCPELNPDEQVWNQIKTKGLRNTCYRTVKELKDRVDDELNKLSQNMDLIAQFFKHPEVAYYA